MLYEFSFEADKYTLKEVDDADNGSEHPHSGSAEETNKNVLAVGPSPKSIVVHGIGHESSPNEGPQNEDADEKGVHLRALKNRSHSMQTAPREKTRMVSARTRGPHRKATKNICLLDQRRVSPESTAFPIVKSPRMVQIIRQTVSQGGMLFVFEVVDQSEHVLRVILCMLGQISILTNGTRTDEGIEDDCGLGFTEFLCTLSEVAEALGDAGVTKRFDGLAWCGRSPKGTVWVETRVHFLQSEHLHFFFSFHFKTRMTTHMTGRMKTDPMQAIQARLGVIRNMEDEIYGGEESEEEKPLEALHVTFKGI